jgi:serine/threonine-protein kinase
VFRPTVCKSVGNGGNVYIISITDSSNRVLKLADGATTATVLPFTGLDYPDGVAVDSGGNLYVTDSQNSRVLKLACRLELHLA